MRFFHTVLAGGLAVVMLTANNAPAQETIVYENSLVTLINDVTVAAMDPGVVQETVAEPGQQVQQGDVLVRLDAETFAAAVEAASIEQEVAQRENDNDINLRYAQSTVAVNRKKLDKSLQAIRIYDRSVTETEIDRLRLELKQSTLSGEQAELQQEVSGLNVELSEQKKREAEIRLERRTVRSPIDGIVLDVPLQSGEAVTAGQAVCRVVNLDRLRVKAVYDARYLGRISPQSTATFTMSGDGEGDDTTSVDATITFISPEIRPSERVFEVWADIENTDRKWSPGSKGSLTIALD